MTKGKIAQIEQFRSNCPQCFQLFALIVPLFIEISNDFANTQYVFKVVCAADLLYIGRGQLERMPGTDLSFENSVISVQ